MVRSILIHYRYSMAMVNGCTWHLFGIKQVRHSYLTLICANIFKEGTYAFYFNGMSMGYGDISVPVIASTLIYIGMDTSCSCNYIYGNMDSVRLWNKYVMQCAVIGLIDDVVFIGPSVKQMCWHQCR